MATCKKCGRTIEAVTVWVESDVLEEARQRHEPLPVTAHSKQPFPDTAASATVIMEWPCRHEPSDNS